MRRRPSRWLPAAAAIVVWVSSPNAARRQSDWSLRVQSLESPAAANSAQPQLSVSTRGALLSWIERDGARATLKFSEWSSGAWSAPRIVAAGDNWFVNWADVPSVLRLPDNTLVAHWLQKSGPGTYAYDVRLAHSTDDGRSWSPSFLPHADTTPAEHGFASLFPLAAGGLGLVWLDGRAMSAAGHATAGHAAGPGGAMTLRFGRFDRNWKQTEEAPVDLRVCDCCPTAAAVTADGPIVAYRDRSEQEIRDIVVSRLERGTWTEPAPVANDNWHITGCPVNGPMLAARGRIVVIAWFSGAENQNRAFVAFSSDAGRSFAKPIRLDDAATLGRVDVELLEDGSAVATWIEYAGGAAELRVRRVHPSGERSPAVTVSPMGADRASGYPRLARHGNQLMFAWIESAPAAPGASSPQLRVRTAVGELPSGRR
jgi:hypothetical protein